MTRILSFIIGTFLFLNVPFAQEATFDLSGFLSHYAEGKKELRSIEFELEVKSESVLVRGKARFDKGNGRLQNRSLFVGEINTPKATQKVGYGDNNEHYMTYKEIESTMSETDAPKVSVYQKSGDALMSAGPPIVASVVNSPFTNSPHYGKIKEDDEVTFKGFEEIGGVSCVKLLIANGNRALTYFIGKNDYLLRRVVTGGSMFGKGETTFSYNIISTNRKFAKEEFDLSVVMNKNAEKGGALALGTQAPDFRLKNLKGEWVSLSDFEGMTVLIDFWGTWCKPCIRDIPELNALHKNLTGEDFVILSVSTHEKNENAVRQLALKKGIEYTVLENGEAVSKQYHIDSYPTLVLVDSSGKVILTKGSAGNQDDISWEALTKFIQSTF